MEFSDKSWKINSAVFEGNELREGFSPRLQDDKLFLSFKCRKVSFVLWGAFQGVFEIIENQ